MKVFKMSDSKLISYITSDFQTRSDMKVGEVEWEKIMNKNFDKFKKAGAVRQTVTQIWNKQGNNRLGIYYSYKDEKAFVACQKLLNGIPEDEDNPSIVNADRGIVVLHETLED